MRLLLWIAVVAGSALADPATPLDAPQARSQRRARLARWIGKDYALLLGQPLTDVLQPRQEGHFLYLTGVTDPDASLLLAGRAAHAIELESPSGPVETREVLFLRNANPRFARFFGLRYLPGEKAAKELAIQTAHAAPRGGRGLARTLTRLLPKEARLWMPRYRGRDHAPVREIRSALKDALAKSRPDIELVDLHPEMSRMRSVKDRYEQAALRRSIAITLAAFRDALVEIRPDSSEAAVDGALLYAVRRRGAMPAYKFVVGSGMNSTIPHYFRNEAPLREGELLVIDAGAAVDRYAADITRTFPIGGEFTARQREIYTAVLRAQLAAIDVVRAGTTLGKVDAAARSVLKKAGLAKYFIHATCHHVGLDVHDPGPTQLVEGMTITVEPGVYIPEEGIGVRIEDIVLVMKDGCEVLSDDFPKDPDDIEALFK